MTQWKEKQGVSWLEFDLLADCPHVKHGVFLRKGGCSEGEFSSLNLGFSTGDCSEKVEKNHERIKETLKLSKLVWATQCHGDAIARVNSRTVVGDERCDALTTAEPELGLVIKHADCQAAIMYDPVQHVASCVHSGWRGSVDNIYAKTVAYMKKHYHSKPENILVGISPSLGPQSAEFIHYKTELPESFWDFQVKPHYFDFWAISRWQLAQSGILPHHIEITDMDTVTAEEHCFSYRRDKQHSGRHGTVVQLMK